MSAVDHERRFAGVSRLFGARGAEQIRLAHVAVVGIGGVGSWSVEALARSGVGRLTLIDMDHVAESNVNRQVQALSDTLGQAKIKAMADRIAAINPDCVVQGVDEFVQPANWPALLPGAVDALIDACDQVRAKTAMAAWACRLGLPFISVGAAGGKRAGEWVQLADLATATHDPLLAQLRYRLRREHGAPREGTMGVACVFSREPVARPSGRDASEPLDGRLSCHGYGSSVTVTAVFGMCAAGWVLQRLAGTGSDKKTP